MKEQAIYVAILATDGFEQSELIEPKLALEHAGFKVDIVSPKQGNIKAWHGENWGEDVAVDDNLITSRSPADLNVFSEALIDALNAHTSS